MPNLYVLYFIKEYKLNNSEKNDLEKLVYIWKDAA